MKKLKGLQLILALVLCLSLSTLFVACNTTEPIKISFETNGGSTIQEIQIDENFQMPANPTKQGYVFDGWYIDQNLTTKFDETKINQYTQSFVVFAKWVDIPLDQIAISTPVLTSNGNVVEWSDVEVTQDLDVTYFVAVDDGAALAYTAKSISLDMFTTGEHKVEVYAALATNNAKKSQTASVTVDVVAVEDNAVITTGYAGTNSTLAKDGNDDVLVFYMGINETITNAQDVTVDSPVVTISNPNNGTGKVVTPKSIGGPCKLTLTRNDNTQKVYKAYVRPRITGFSVSNNNVDDRAGYQISDDLSYTIGVANDFSFNVTMLDGDGEIIENRYVPLDIVFKKDNVVLSESETTYQNDKGVLSFDQSLVGQNYTVSIKPKYVPSRDAGQVVETTMSINFTNGINVFDNEDLKQAVQNCDVSEITIHNEIVAEFNDDQKYQGADYARHVAAADFTKQNYTKTANVYSRFVDENDSVKTLTINGNYFDINARELPLLKQEQGKNDGSDGCELYIRKPNGEDGYWIYNQQAGLFAFASNKPGFSVNLKNLHILGNCDLSNETDDAIISKQFILEQSGSLHGIVARGVTINADNVWMQNVMQGYQLTHNPDWIDSQSTFDMTTQANLSYARVENTFYSSVYVYGAKASVNNSYFANS
ncbi:MAG: InlB B-repeat-containing protein, partial [Clostridia bacterium]|nr:InlB B-repeat-containing protein [Clostridia bacterium]